MIDYSIDINDSVGNHRYGVIGAFAVLAIFGIAMFAIIGGARSRTVVSVATAPGASVAIDDQPAPAGPASDGTLRHFRVKPGSHAVTFQIADGTMRTQHIVVARGQAVMAFAISGDSLREVLRR